MSAVEHMHSRNIMHCQLCPQNIIVSENQEMKIKNFGQSKLVNDNGMFMRELKKADMVAVGCVLFEMLTLRRPFEASSAASTFEKLVFPHDVCLSNSCKHFVSALLCESLELRLSARQALWHPWLCWSASPSLSSSTPFELDLTTILSEVDALNVDDILSEVDGNEEEEEEDSFETVLLDEQEEDASDGILDVMSLDELMSDQEIHNDKCIAVIL